MRIFLSYASEQRPIAEQIAYTLRVRGHFAFFDKEQLPVADSFDEQISLAIDTSDVLIFLISPEAVTPGRYTLTELVFAPQSWLHRHHCKRFRTTSEVFSFWQSREILPRRLPRLSTG
jgi:TIR domain